MPLIDKSVSKTTSFSTPKKNFWTSYSYLLMPLLTVLLLGLGYLGLTMYQANKTQENIKKIGKIVESSTQDGVTAWLVETSHGKDVVYTSESGKVLFAGQAFNADSGDAMFTKLASQAAPKETTSPQDASAKAKTEDVAANAAAAGQDDLTPGQAIGEWKGEVPKAMQILDTLKGFKIGDAPVQNTVFIMYDPRCPYCHNLMQKSQSLDLKAKGIAIKWLPTVALGSNGIESNEVKRAAAALHVTNPKEFYATFEKDNAGVAATQDDMNELSKNLAFLYDAAHQTFGGDAPVAVPAAFYLDKKSGSPRMVYAVQEDAIYRSIFGD